MPEYNLSSVEALVVDPQPNIRRIIRNTLTKQGIKVFYEADSPQSATERFSGTSPDLMIIDADTADSEAFPFVSQIRHGSLLRNPYLGVIVSTFQPTNVLLARVTNCGADDLLLKPVSVKGMEERIAALIEGRKGFVVTSDYVGPDRRKSSRAGTVDIPLIQVPNFLRYKALGQFDEIDTAGEIARANDEINHEKQLRHAFQTAFLIEFALPGLSQQPPEQIAIDHLRRVPSVVEDLLRRMRDPTARKLTEVIGRALTDHFERIMEPDARAPHELEKLREAARGMLRAVSVNNNAATQLESEVLGAVVAYRKRIQEIVAQRTASGMSDTGKDQRSESDGAAATAPAA